MPEGHRPVIARYRAMTFRCPSDSRAKKRRYHTIVRGQAGISPGSLRVPRGIRVQEPGRYPTETYARCMTKLVKKIPKNFEHWKHAGRAPFIHPETLKGRWSVIFRCPSGDRTISEMSAGLWPRPVRDSARHSPVLGRWPYDWGL